MLNWASQFNICCYLDDNEYHERFHSFDCLLGVGANQVFSPSGPVPNVLEQLGVFINLQDDWLFGHFNYDLKNGIESLYSHHTDHIGFPEIFLFQPETVIEVKNNTVVIGSLTGSPANIFEQIIKFTVDRIRAVPTSLSIQPRTEKDDYLSTIQKLKQHILRGDCYEINFCQEFFVANAQIDPLEVYQNLSVISPAPFSCFYKLEDKFLLCASPERYIKKTGDTIISQPIKGTARRNMQNADEDELLRTALFNSKKDRSENVMIVDLVRNDLSKICTEGSVSTQELFGIYTFPQVHQMISTVEGELKAGTGLADVLQATFPMGSMTGAPKRKVMELIEQFEPVKRGIFSGAVGYVKPGGDFDFNVVIRSIMYNATAQYLNYLVGGGITFYSNAEQEYEECLLKAQAMERALK